MTMAPLFSLLVLALSALLAAGKLPDGGNEGVPQYHRFIIVGAGPGGLQLARYLESASRDFLVLEKSAISGSFFASYPRFRQLISINKRFSGFDNLDAAMRHDWNSLLSDDSHAFNPTYSSSDPDYRFSDIPKGLLFRDFADSYYPEADKLVAYLNHWASHHGLDKKIRHNSTVLRVSPIADGGSDKRRFRLSTADGAVFECSYLIWAAGLQQTVASDSVSVEQAISKGLVHTYSSVPTDLALYRNKSVLILGRGNAAFELANNFLEVTSRVHLVGRAPRRVKLAVETHYPGDVRSIHSHLLETYLLKSLDGMAEGLLGDLRIAKNETSGRIIAEDQYEPCRKDKYGRDSTECSLFRSEYDFVVSCTGWMLDTSPFDKSIRPLFHSNKKHPLLTPAFESVNVPGLFFAGTLMHGRDHKKSSGGFIHGFRYLVRALYRHLEETERSKSSSATAVVPAHPGWPRRSLNGLREIAEALLWRMNNAAGPYQMFSGGLADLVLLSPSSFPEAAADAADAAAGAASASCKNMSASAPWVSVGVRAAGDEPWGFLRSGADQPASVQRCQYVACSAFPSDGASALEALADSSSSPSLTELADELYPLPELIRTSGSSDDGIAAAAAAESAQRKSDEAIDRALEKAVIFEEVPSALVPEKILAWSAEAGHISSTETTTTDDDAVVDFITSTLEFSSAPTISASSPGAYGDNKDGTSGSQQEPSRPAVSDPYALSRVNASVVDAEHSTFLHPVLRYYRLTRKELQQSADRLGAKGILNAATSLGKKSKAMAGKKGAAAKASAGPVAGGAAALLLGSLPEPAIVVHILEDFNVAFTHHLTHVLPVTKLLQEIGARKANEAIKAKLMATSCRSAAASPSFPYPSTVARPLISAGLPSSENEMEAMLSTLMQASRSRLYLGGHSVPGGILSAWFQRLSFNATQRLIEPSRGPRAFALHVYDPLPVPHSEEETAHTIAHLQEAELVDSIDPSLASPLARRVYPLPPPPMTQEQERSAKLRLLRMQAFHARCSARYPDLPIVAIMARSGKEMEVVSTLLTTVEGKKRQEDERGGFGSPHGHDGDDDGSAESRIPSVPLIGIWSEPFDPNPNPRHHRDLQQQQHHNVAGLEDLNAGNGNTIKGSFERLIPGREAADGPRVPDLIDVQKLKIQLNPDGSLPLELPPEAFDEAGAGGAGAAVEKRGAARRLRGEPWQEDTRSEHDLEALCEQWGAAYRAIASNNGPPPPGPNSGGIPSNSNGAASAVEKAISKKGKKKGKKGKKGKKTKSAAASSA